MDHCFDVEQPINCFLCQMKFTDIDKLVHHQVMHIYKPSETEIQPQQEYFDCKICGRSFRCELKRINHYIRFHASHLIRKDIEADERYKSDQCDNEYIGLNYLQQHMKSEPSSLTIKDDDLIKSEHKPSVITIEDDNHMKSELKPSVITIDDDHIKSKFKTSVITIKDDEDDSTGIKVPRMIIKRAKMKYPPRWPFCNP